MELLWRLKQTQNSMQLERVAHENEGNLSKETKYKTTTQNLGRPKAAISKRKGYSGEAQLCIAL